MGRSRSGRATEQPYSRICAWVKDGMAQQRRFTDHDWLLRRGTGRVVVHHSRPAVREDAEHSARLVKDDSRFSGLVPCTPAEHDALHAGAP